MTRPTPQEVYATAQHMAVASDICRAVIFSGLGGTLIPNESQPMTPDEAFYKVTLYGVTGSGLDQVQALADWIRQAKDLPRDTRTARATDGRPDCPYNGAAPLPPARTRVAEAA
ncbi:hypothetical protein K3725_09875 [Leisingera sp. S132]|uniref:hypothetical protein n=1 Tax=Leisingera sp. S132 TaxID=2867016 RepID=UPI0021A2CA91|nr:hypothetical protein [Leisingera sp. S132]UWQ77631.1 hypothetical protein K3725_09875 [Leisingera sp. S132]